MGLLAAEIELKILYRHVLEKKAHAHTHPNSWLKRKRNFFCIP